jgi:hypothetical protein
METTDFEREHQIQVMVSTALKGKAPDSWSKVQWKRFYSTFRAATLSPRGLAAHIYHGYSFTPVWREARREENFISGGHIAFDFDAGDESSSLPYLMRSSTFAWLFASFAYATPSSTPEAPRSRVVFVLEYPIYDPAEYREAYAAVAWKMAADGSTCDPACKDPLRLYYGSPKCDMVPNWSVLGKAALDWVVEEYRDAHPPALVAPSLRVVVEDPSDIMQQVKIRQMTDKIRMAAANEGHNTLLKQARLAGGFIASNSLSEHDVFCALVDAYMMRPGATPADLKSVEQTVRDGINYGMRLPVHFEAAQSVGGILS